MANLLTIPECAAAAGVSTRQIERMVAAGRIKSIRRACVKVLVSEPDLQAWMGQRRSKAVVAEPTEPMAPVVAETTQSEQPAVTTTAGEIQ